MRSLALALTVVWAWVDAGGVYCFTDDLDRVPAEYRDAAVERELSPITNYDRYTPVIKENPDEHRS